MTISYTEYWTEVSDLATNIIEEAICNNFENEETDTDQVMEIIQDTVLHEAIDGHQWVIYYHNNMDVIQHSDNDEYMIDNFGIESVGETLQGSGLSGLHSSLAFWALHADASEKIHDLIDESIEEHNSRLEELEEEET